MLSPLSSSFSVPCLPYVYRWRERCVQQRHDLRRWPVLSRIQRKLGDGRANSLQASSSHTVRESILKPYWQASHSAGRPIYIKYSVIEQKVRRHSQSAAIRPSFTKQSRSAVPLDDAHLSCRVGRESFPLRTAADVPFERRHFYSSGVQFPSAKYLCNADNKSGGNMKPLFTL